MAVIILLAEINPSFPESSDNNQAVNAHMAQVAFRPHGRHCYFTSTKRGGIRVNVMFILGEGSYSLM